MFIPMTIMNLDVDQSLSIFYFTFHYAKTLFSIKMNESICFTALLCVSKYINFNKDNHKY